MSFFLLPHGANNPRNSEGAFVELADGSILFAYTQYYGGDWHDECSANIAAIRSRDGGHTWSEPQVIIRNQSQNVMSVSLLHLQDGRIAMVVLQKTRIPGHDGRQPPVCLCGTIPAVDCRPKVYFSADEALSWSAPVEICDAPAVYLVAVNDCLRQLKSGRLILPVSHHRYGGNARITTPGLGLFYLSDDAGATWRESRVGCFPPADLSRGLMEPGVAELTDGRILGWYRTRGGCQYKTWSYDHGESWTPPVPATEFPSPEAPLAMKRNPKDGCLYAVWNDYHPERSVKFAATGPAVMGRTPLVIAKSDDDGATWKDHRVIEDAPDHGFAYTAMLFHGDDLLLAYCAGGLPDCECMLQDIRIRVLPL